MSIFDNNINNKFNSIFKNDDFNSFKSSFWGVNFNNKLKIEILFYQNLTKYCSFNFN